MSNQAVLKLIMGATFCFFVACKGNDSIEEQKKEINTFCYSEFVNPSNTFRSHPFYSINDSLTESEIRRQIAGFKQAGFGGFYLHSRSGLITKFLGDEWWKIMQASVDAANKTGLECMFYDEDRWPSGYAGGIIPKMNKDYRAKCLARLEKKTKVPVGGEIIQSDSLYNYILYTAQLGYDIFNGTCYTDLFNKEAVRAFINAAHKPYVDKYKAEIKTYIPAIFSDEAHVHARYFDKKTPNKGVLSYSPSLEKKFMELYGYNLREKLNLLFEEKENWREVRMQYYRAKALAFEESYTKQIADFCGKNGFIFTGHYLAEDVLRKVRDRAGNTMLHYRSMQQPGMDLLGLSIDKKLITARNLSSVANQFGKQKRLTEVFGISGQNMNFGDRKWLAGWHAILGINHFCPHLTLYSMRGHRKRDYPPTFSYQQPYWAYNKKIEDYLGRIAYATTVGKYAPQILVISPLESEFVKSNKEGEFTGGMLKVLGILQKDHLDYDVGDEQIMADTAFVKGDKIVIGEMSYKDIILPDMISIRENTIDLLLSLSKNGGLIFNTGRFPRFVDGKVNAEKLRELKNIVTDVPENELKTLLLSVVTPHVKVTGKDASKIWTQTRMVPHGRLVQFSNISHTQTIRFSISLNVDKENLVLWNPSKVKCYRLTTCKNGTIDLELAPSSNIWITSGELSKEARISGNYRLPGKFDDEIILESKWTGKRLSPNAITLDFARYSVNGGKTFSAPEPVIGIFNRLSDQRYSGKLLLSYAFNVEIRPPKCQLVLEQPQMYSAVLLNGDPVTFKNNGYFCDRYFRKSDMLASIKKGKNNIQLSLDFKAPEPLSEDEKKRYGTEIESIYLIGDFAVSGKKEKETFKTQRNQSGNFQLRPVHQFSGFSISAEKELFKGDLTTEGYPFFSGAFELSHDFSIEKIDPDKKYYAELPNCESVASIIEINGNVVDTLVWAPFRTEINHLLKPGKNIIKVILVNSLRNLLGPSHHKKGELIKVGPKSFTGLGGFPDGRGQRNWYDTRKENDSNPIWTDTYNMIPFGFVKPVKIISRTEVVHSGL